MTCPICRKPTVSDYRPFCSRRCADIDLGRWFSESYAIPAEDLEIPDEDEDSPRGGHCPDTGVKP